MSISFQVRGTPVPQGSLRANMAGGKPVIHYTNREPLAVWRDAIRAACPYTHPVTGPFHISVMFTFKRPAGHYNAKGDILPRYAGEAFSHRPDLDKLVRAVLDALTMAVWRDDGQVTSIYAGKVYAEEPGCFITIASLDEARIARGKGDPINPIYYAVKEGIA